MRFDKVTRKEPNMPSTLRLQGWRSLSACGVLYLLMGCSGVDELAIREREIAELSFQAERMRESLRELYSVRDQLQGTSTTLSSEHARLEKEVVSLTNTLRLAREQTKTLSAQKESFRIRLENTEDANRRLEDSLTRVKNVASESAGELADLRLRRQEMEDRLKTVTETNNLLSADSARLSKEVGKLEDELTRTRAVARSLREGTDVPFSDPAFADFRDSMARLERENADLRGALRATKRQLDFAEQNGGSPEVASARVVSAADDNPEVLLGEVRTFLGERYDRATRGEFAWDGFDLSVLFGTFALALLGGVLFVRWRRARRMRRELENLRVTVQELEEALGPGDVPAVDGAVQARGRSTPVRSSARTARGFHAVVPSRTTDGSDEVDVDDGTAAPEFPAETGSSAAAPLNSSAEADPFAELLKKGSDTDREEALTLTSADSEAATQPAAEAEIEVDDSFEDGDTANTQVLPSMDEVDLSDPAPEAGSTESIEDDDRDILNELKSVINKKFDELLK